MHQILPYTGSMGTQIDVSEFGRRINIGVKAEMGIHRLSNRALAKQIARSERYVRDRINGSQEWAIADLERMCSLWGMTFGQITSYADVDNTETTLTDDERRDLVLRKLKAGDMRLAAHVDPYKHEEMEGGDGR